MKLSILVAMASITAVATAASAESIVLTAHLSGAAVMAGDGNKSKGGGDAHFNFDTDTHQLQYFLTYDGLSGPATIVDVHGPATAGANGPIARKLPGVSSPLSGTATLNGSQASELLSGQLYLDVHTDAHPLGEIRGQIQKQ